MSPTFVAVSVTSVNFKPATLDHFFKISAVYVLSLVDEKLYWADQGSPIPVEDPYPVTGDVDQIDAAVA
jgi:hypothetical protein